MLEETVGLLARQHEADLHGQVAGQFEEVLLVQSPVAAEAVIWLETAAADAAAAPAVAGTAGMAGMAGFVGFGAVRDAGELTAATGVKVTCNRRGAPAGRNFTEISRSKTPMSP